MYAKGMTTSDIEAHIKDIYGLECSDTTISRITDKILPIVREWQSRPLEEIYAVVFMDAIDITKKWTGKRKDWGQIHSQLEIFFADRLPQ